MRRGALLRFIGLSAQTGRHFPVSSNKNASFLFWIKRHIRNRPRRFTTVQGIICTFCLQNLQTLHYPQFVSVLLHFIVIYTDKNMGTEENSELGSTLPLYQIIKCITSFRDVKFSPVSLLFGWFVNRITLHIHKI